MEVVYWAGRQVEVIIIYMQVKDSFAVAYGTFCYDSIHYIRVFTWLQEVK